MHKKEPEIRESCVYENGTDQLSSIDCDFRNWEVKMVVMSCKVEVFVDSVDRVADCLLRSL